MKKIMFNDKYGLTEAVLSGRKTMTRRIVPIGIYNQTDWKAVSDGDYEAVSDGEGNWHDIRLCGQYQIGEEVAVAQSYRDADVHFIYSPDGQWGCVDQMAGYKNKMFVRADLMPHRIRITDIKVERLQDISEADIMREGIMEGEFMNTWDRYYYDHWGDVPNHITFRNPQLAYHSLIDRICGKGTWDSNPFVFVYEFELSRKDFPDI